MIQVLYVLLWWLTLFVIGLLCFPLVSRICRGLPDKGYCISKLTGLLSLTYFAWIFANLNIVPFGLAGILVALLLIVTLSFSIGRKNLRVSNWPFRQIIVSESIFAVGFIVFPLILIGNPDIFPNMGDYFANHAFMNSLTRGGYFPPTDPWFAGESIPYYYGGHLMVAGLSLALKVPPAIAFNIAGAMFAALTATVAYGLVYNITRRKLYGFIAILFMCFVGYTSGTFRLVAYIFQQDILGFPTTSDPSIIEWLLNFRFWDDMQMLEGAIVHYPYYKFLRWDLHSYLMSVPFQLMFIMVIYALFQKNRQRANETACLVQPVLSGVSENDEYHYRFYNRVVRNLLDILRYFYRVSKSDTALEICILGLCLGFFAILNTWEYPTYIVFTLFVFILLGIGPTIKSNVVVLTVIVGLSFILYIPHYIFGGMSGFDGLGFVHNRTSLFQFLEFGVVFVFAVTSLVFMISKRDILTSRSWIRIAVFASVAVLTIVATTMPIIILDFPLLILVVPIGLLGLFRILTSKQKTATEFILVLILMGMALILFGEVIYVNDALSGEWERFNTMTKIYMQIWVFLAISSAYAVFYMVGRMGRKTKMVWTSLLVILVIICLVHPIALSTSALSGRNTYMGLTRGTLDGMAFIEKMDKGDYEAIKWINDNISGSPVILEKPGTSSNYESRISTFTGLPTVIGQRMPEATWGRGGPASERCNEVDLIYNTVDNSEALELLRKFDVEYIYVGTVERNAYDSEGLNKFSAQSQVYEVEYEKEGVVIYRIRR